VLVVGPEGGLEEGELELLGAGRRLGPEILRTSTAGAVAAGVLLAGSPRWR
jgi:16S rRNA (uracil1498-N3)-methyltransferase